MTKSTTRGKNLFPPPSLKKGQLLVKTGETDGKKGETTVQPKSNHPGIQITENAMSKDRQQAKGFPLVDGRGALRRASSLEIEEEVGFSTSASNTLTQNELNRFQDRLRKRRLRTCPSCSALMTKSSRRVLAASAGGGLVLIGILLMTTYGLATNFYDPPWFLKFALPALYYVGSLFIGVGVIFFFIRERVWRCTECRALFKR